jgi:hypothetical protein
VDDNSINNPVTFQRERMTSTPTTSYGTGASLTALIPNIYEALDIVARELVGMIPAVSRNASAERAAMGQNIVVPVTQAATAQDTTPAVTAPPGSGSNIQNVSIKIDRSKFVPILWGGEEQRGLLNAGTYAGILTNQFAQAFRTLTNMIESDLWTVSYQNSTRGYGTPGTSPFGTAGDLSHFAQARAILDANGVPQSDLHAVLGSAAVANLRGKQSLLLKLNESGSDVVLRMGAITELPVEGFAIHNSAAVQAVTTGAGASYVTSGASAAGVGQIALTTGSGAINAGDLIQFANDTSGVNAATNAAGASNYIVQAGISAPGTIGIAAPPGLMQAVASGAAVTNPAASNGRVYTPNLAFHKSAIQLVARLPASPIGPDGRAMDMADDSMVVTDPVSGLSFEIAVYRQFMQVSYHVRLAWGFQAVMPKYIATIIG